MEYAVLLNGARTLNWCHTQRARLNAADAAAAADKATEVAERAVSLRHLLVLLIKRFWSEGAGKSQSPDSALRASDLLKATVALPSELKVETSDAAADIVNDVMHSIVDVYRVRRASLPTYPKLPGLLDSESPPDIPQADSCAAKMVEVLDSLLAALKLNIRKSGIEMRSPQNPFHRLPAEDLSHVPQNRRADLLAGYLKAMKLMMLIKLLSAVSVCNVFAGQLSTFSSTNLNISTAFVSNVKLGGYGLASRHIETCYAARDPASCCARTVFSFPQRPENCFYSTISV
jgi:hypothetical protein